MNTMQATQILLDEHDATLVVLDELERAVSAAERGAPVPKSIFADIEEFFTIFVDRCHHGKEEAMVFERLDGISSAEPVLEHLAADHRTGRMLSSCFREAVGRYVPGDLDSARALADTSRAYDVMLRQHICDENAELFAAMEASLKADDEQLVEEFDRWEHEQIGEGTHERLHGMIDSLPGRIDRWVTWKPVASVH